MAQPSTFRILDQRGNAELRASLGKGSGEAAQGLRLDNGKDNDIQKRNLPFLVKKLIVLAIVQSESIDCVSQLSHLTQLP